MPNDTMNAISTLTWIFENDGRGRAQLDKLIAKSKPRERKAHPRYAIRDATGEHGKKKSIDNLDVVIETLISDDGLNKLVVSADSPLLTSVPNRKLMASQLASAVVEKRPNVAIRSATLNAAVVITAIVELSNGLLAKKPVEDAATIVFEKHGANVTTGWRTKLTKGCGIAVNDDGFLHLKECIAEFAQKYGSV